MRYSRTIGSWLLGAMLGAVVASGYCATTAVAQEAPPETLAQCLQKLATAQQTAATLEKMQQDAQAKRTFLLTTGGGATFLPVPAVELQAMLTEAIYTGQVSPRGVLKYLRTLGAQTRANLRKLNYYVGAAQELADTQKDKCDAIKNAPAPTTTVEPPTTPPTTPTTPTTPTGSTTPLPALALTIELSGAKETVDLSNGNMSVRPGDPSTQAHLKSGPAYDGTVSISGTLPDGYTVYVFYHSAIWKVLTPEGGKFTVQESSGFGAANDVEGWACLEGPQYVKGGPLPNDIPAANGQPAKRGCLSISADIGIYWTPG